ncbi:Tol-Pal system protein TolQ [Gammaproteobacteria bacterium]|nr:protein TolQ [Gammaproteobacteria bacterium]QOJ31456.1 MAG: protein TolQ [Gammaproteobacteria bacterium]CAG0943103.1 Tol-Pal system protein TolQ [Gammaproteobacteria bacterium]
MTGSHSFLDLVLGASFVVQLVLLLLVSASIASWAIILRKRRTLREAALGSDAFESTFWGGGDLTAIYRDVTKAGSAPSGMAGLFEAGFREFRRLAQQPGLAPQQLLEGCRRAMQVAQMREMDRLEQNLATLATIGSTSPYVGLFGTVWGIMNSFQAIGNVQSATLAMVAPGISEALIATAMGLFAAIPAVIAYNRYADKVTRLEVRFDTFTEEFSAILQRHAHPRPAGEREGK